MEPQHGQCRLDNRRVRVLHQQVVHVAQRVRLAVVEEIGWQTVARGGAGPGV